METENSIVRFGVFRVDLVRREVLKHGTRIRLSGQAFSVLARLLTQPGQPVSREELRRMLWPKGTFVDFDHSLNAVMNRLRSQLSDSAEQQHYIETVSGLGYRFVASLEPVPAGDGHAPLNERVVANEVVPQPATVSRDPGHTSRWSLLSFSITAVGGTLLLGALTWFIWGRISRHGSGEQEPQISSIVVLPLENLSGDPGQEYFADGMTAELITELAKIASLRVISRTSAMLYKRTRKPLAEIARELNVDALVEGEVLKSDRRVRITAQLIHTATDRHLWAETYERDLRDAVELQGEVAESIATAIRTKVTPEEHAELAGNHRVNPEAYEAYLKGRFFWNKRTGPGLKKAVEYLQQAIAKDPAYALAYAALADCYEIWSPHDLPPTRDAYLKAKATAEKALELDSSLGEAHTVLAGIMYELNRDWHGAEREFKRAIALSPGYATAHQRYSTFLSKMGRHEESLREIHRALVLDPLSPPINSGLGARLLWARRYEEAAEQLQKSLEMDPGLGLTHMYLGWAYERKGDLAKAIDELRKATLLDGGPRELASLAQGYALGGYARETKNILNDLEERFRRSYVPPYDIAIVYAGLGKKDRAFEWLNKSCQDRDVEFVALKVDLELDNLRSDLRFQDLLRCAGLAE